MTKYFLLAVVCLLAIGTELVAQVPQHFISKTPNIKNGSAFLLGSLQNKGQNIYHPSNFSGTSSGMISHIYFRSATAVTGISSYENFTVKLGYTMMDYWPSTGLRYFITGLTTVINSPSYVVSDTITDGGWVRLPLQTPFFFNSSGNLVVEVSQGPMIPVNGFQVYCSTDTNLLIRRISGDRDSLYSPSAGSGIYYWDFGFDFAPADVSDTKEIESLILYPNPSEGRFTIAARFKQGVNSVNLSIRSLTGQVVFNSEFKNLGRSLDQAVDVYDLPKGMYFVEFIADNERINRKMMFR